jgi:hypothetical protein
LDRFRVSVIRRTAPGFVKIEDCQFHPSSEAPLDGPCAQCGLANQIYDSNALRQIIEDMVRKPSSLQSNPL